MNKSWLKDKNVQVILACTLALVVVYAVDIYRLAALLTPWETFGETSIVPAHLLFFTGDTPNVIGYTEKGSGERVECAEAVAYMATAAGETYRCCDTGSRVSCTDGNFSNEIPSLDPNCTEGLISTFGVPASLPEAKDYLVYGACSESGNSELTMAQLDADGQIRWKTLVAFGPGVVASTLRCVVGPALFALAIRAFIIMRRKPDPDRQIRRW